MNWICKLGFAGIAAVLVGGMLTPATAGDISKRGTVRPKHDSNSLHQLGNAIQYPFRKAGENISVGTHQTIGHNSVVKDKKDRSTNVVKPNGRVVVISKDNPRIGWKPLYHKSGYESRPHHNFVQKDNKYYWVHGHRYYRDQNTGKRVKID